MSTYTRKTPWGIVVETRDDEVDLSDILDEVDTSWVVEYLSGREIGAVESVVLRKLLVRLLGLPELYYADEQAVVRD